MKRFVLPALVLIVAGGTLAESSWKARFLSYRAANPDRTEAPYFGVTVWRLDATPQARDGAHKLAVTPSGVVGSAMKESGWTPRKFPVNAPMAPGQKFVLSIEASRAGKLFIFQTAGPLRVTESPVSPGQIVLVPQPQAKPAYFTAGQSGGEYRILFSSKEVAPDPNESQLREWSAKWKADVASQTVPAASGAAVSAAELLAANHAWTLTPDDAPPLSIYHCASCQPESPLSFRIQIELER